MNTDPNTFPKNRIMRNQNLELLIILLFSCVIYIFAAKYDVLERIVEFSQQHEEFELDEVITVSVFLVFALALFSFRRLRELQKAKCRLNCQNKELQKALSEINQLRGIIPICSSCKNIRDDKGSWHQVESYVSEHTEADFSHGICPPCSKKLYPEFFGVDTETEEGEGSS